jgi:hypothetical protein
MRVFVGFGYNPDEEWIATVVLPVLAHVGIEVVEGKEIPGMLIDPELERRIDTCDAMIGLLTRRGNPAPDGLYGTSAHVVSELEYACSRGLPTVQVLQQGVRRPATPSPNLQRLTYLSGQKAELLRDLTRHIRGWVDGVVTIRLQPDHLARRLALSALQGTAFCDYTILPDNNPIQQRRARLRGAGGGLFFKVLGFRPGTQVQVSVEVDGATWASNLADHTTPFAQIELRPL